MFSYDDTLPADLDRVRFQLGDTDAASALVTDEHINAVLLTQGSVSAAAAYIASGLVARISRTPMSFTADGSTFNFGSRLDALKAIANSGSTPTDGAVVTAGSVAVPVVSVW